MKEEEIIQLFYGSSPASGGEAPNEKPPALRVEELDDCSPIPGGMIVTTDSLSEGTHFRREWSSPGDLATKLYHVNLSDLVCSGGKPEWILLNLGLPEDLPAHFLPEFALALRNEMELHGGRIVGGDTYRSPTIQLTLTLGGPAERFLQRKDGRPGDHLYLTGNIGLALLGYRSLKEEGLSPTTPLRQLAMDKFLRPRARDRWAGEITSNPQVHATMDLSDGLFLDANKLARAGGLVLEIDLEKIPLPSDAEGELTPEEAIFSGEEFEILFLGEEGLSFTFPCRPIGKARSTAGGEKPGVLYFKEGSATDVGNGGFLHFR